MSKAEEERVKELIDFCDKLEEAEVNENGMFNFNVIAPYSNGKNPQPVKWEADHLA